MPASEISALRETALAHALGRQKLFQGLPAQELEEIARITSLKNLAKGDYLFRESDPATGFYIVQTGAINVHRVNMAGREQVIHIFRAGESLAEASLTTDRGYPADARAVEPSQVLFIQRNGFIAAIRKHPELALRMLSAMAVHLRVLVSQIDDLQLKDVETRLANWLIRRCPDPDSTKPALIELTITKRTLAAELGTVSETLSRTMARLRSQNLMAVHGKTLIVMRPRQLSALIRKHLEGG